MVKRKIFKNMVKKKSLNIVSNIFLNTNLIAIFSKDRKMQLFLRKIIKRL